MKKLGIMAIALTFITVNGYAQDDDREKIQMGAKIGMNYANVYDSEGEEFDADPKLRMAAGVFLAIPIGTYIGIQPEVLFSQKGFKATGSILGEEYKFTRTTNYIDIPIYLALKPSSFLTIVAGPQFSYLMSRKDNFESSFLNTEQEDEFDNENIRKNTLGASLGLDININHFVIGARAAWDLQDNKGDGTSSTPRYKKYLVTGNSWFQVLISS